MRAMILAAGRGERLRPLTERRPKPLLEAAGMTLLEYHLRALAAADVRQVVINTSWLAEQIHAAIGDGSRYGLEVFFSDEGPVALETGGGIAHALGLLGSEPFLVVNGDVYSDYPFDALSLRDDDDLAQLVLVDNPTHHPRGDFALWQHRVRNSGDASLTFSGIALYRPEFFAGRDGAFALAPLLREAAIADRIGGERFDGAWWDIGSRERLEALDAWLKTG